MSLVTLKVYTFPYEMAIHKSKLEAFGIECFTQDELTVQIHNFYSNAVGGVKLKVRKSDYETAMEILGEEYDIQENEVDAKWRCPNCGSGNVEAQGLNGQLSMVLLYITGLPIPIFSGKAKCFNCYETFKITKTKSS